MSGRERHVRDVFARELAAIGDAALRDKVVRTWVRAMEMSGATDLARDVPGLKKIAKKGTPPEGLGLEHVRGVVRFAEAIAAAEEAAHGATPDRDVVVAGALLHDVGKLLEKAPADRHPLAGTLVRHAFSGVHVAMLEDVPAEVLHIIAYHAAEGHRIQRTLECHIVYMADNLSVDALERRELGTGLAEPYVYVPEA
jgi:putative nucleotidyltransferase with HDIG domain